MAYVISDECVSCGTRSVQERLTKINAELDMKPKEEPKKMIKKEELKKCL